MRPLHHAALVTTGAQETARIRLRRALELDSEWRYEQDARSSSSDDDLRARYRRVGTPSGR